MSEPEMFYDLKITRKEFKNMFNYQIDQEQKHHEYNSISEKFQDAKVSHEIINFLKIAKNKKID